MAEAINFVSVDSFYKGTQAIPPQGRYLQVAPTKFKRLEHGGNGSIWGTIVEVVDKVDVPRSREVRLFIQKDSRHVGTTWSDPITGAYRFDNLQEGLEFFLVSFDYTQNLGAIIGDRIVPTKIE